MLIEEGIGIDELRSILEKMDNIGQAFESGEVETLMKEPDEYAEKKIEVWCAKHGLEYNPTDEESAQEFINGAIKRVRAEEKQGVCNVI